MPLQRLGQLRARGLAEPPGALLAHQRPGLQQRAQPLLQEQRVAVGAGQHGVQDLPAGAVAHQRPGQLLFDRPGQRAELQPAGVEAVQRRGGLGPAGGQDQQAAARGQPGQVEGEAERGRVGPVQVLQDEHRRARGHQACDQRAPGGEGLFLEFPWAHPAQRRSRRQAHHAGQQREQVAAPDRGQHPLQGGPGHRRGLVRRHSRPVGQQLLVEAVGRGRGVGGAGPLQPPRAAGGAPAALLHQAGLAEPGLAGHQHDRAVTAGRLAQGGAERR